MKPIKQNFVITFKVIPATMYHAAKITTEGTQLVKSQGRTYQTVDIFLEIDNEIVEMGTHMLTEVEPLRQQLETSLTEWLKDSLCWYTRAVVVNEMSRLSGATNRRSLTKIKREMSQRVNQIAGNERGRPKASNLDKAILAEQWRERIQAAIKLLRKSKQEINQANVATALKIVQENAAEPSKARALRRALERAGLTWEEFLKGQ